MGLSLSIEEKARAYDKVVESARMEKEKSRSSKLLEFIDENFPELKDEDERIGKEIIEYFQQFEDENLRGVNISDWVAWLKKWAKHIEFINKIKIGDKVTRNKDGVLVNLSQLDRVAKKNENQCEQKPVDKVEPKFKVGDWVTDGVAKCQICFIDDTQYWYSENCILGSIESIDKKYHLWTIQDVKNGDVLAFYSEYKGNKMVQVGIIEKYVGKHGGCSNTFKIYVGVNWENHLQIGEYMGCSSDIRPSTEEQRDLLFQKIGESNYEWDDDKKELKKILQEYPLTPDKPAVFSEQKTVWGEEDEDAMGMAIIALENMYDPNSPNDTYAGYTMPFNKAALRLRALRERPCTENEWCEDDEKMIRGLIAICDEWATSHSFYPIENCDMEKLKNWLNFLKERVQPKQDWSEEDEGNLKNVLWAIQKVRDTTEDVHELDIMQYAEDWLRSLKERYGWRPSEEQMDALYTYIYHPQYFSSPDPRMELVESIYQDLKKLKG